MKSLTFTATRDGGMKFAPQTRMLFKQQLMDNPGKRYEIQPLKVESERMRGYFEGALVSLVTFYQEGRDHHSTNDLRLVREWLKLHLNAEYCVIGGVSEKVAKSTKGALKDVIERTTEWVTENYAPPEEALNPEKYKKWRDEVFPFGGPDNYIDYLVDIGLLHDPSAV